MSYVNENKLQKSNIQNLSKALENYGIYLQRNGKGSVPFDFGFNKDYHPNMIIRDENIDKT